MDSVKLKKQVKKFEEYLIVGFSDNFKKFALKSVFSSLGYL
jgi:hypothetical protein